MSQYPSRDATKEFVDQEISAVADLLDESGETPRALIERMGEFGLLRGELGSKWSGFENPTEDFGFVCREVGRASMSLLSLLTVHGMVGKAIELWGTQEQKETWLTPMSCGRMIGSFALTEPQIGSDASRVQTTLTKTSSGYLLNGSKKWISYGVRADLFLVFAQIDRKPVALLVPASCKGVVRRPITGMLGFRASMISEISFTDVALQESAIVGRIGFGISMVALSALDLGRFAIAQGSLGLGLACLEAAVEHATSRKQFEKPLREHQLIQGLMTEMDCSYTCARLLCQEMEKLRAEGDPAAMVETAKAKLVASKMASLLSDNTVQILGASGCSAESSAQRYYRDARLTRIIEGSDQMQQIMIAQNMIVPERA